MAELVDLGEEWLHITDVTTVTSLDLLVYNDSTDSIADTNNLGDITSEPSGASYARQAANISVSQISGDVGFDNDNQETFDMSDSTQTIDHYGYETDFQATIVASQGASQENLLLTGALSQTYDLSNVDTLNINAGAAGNTIN